MKGATKENAKKPVTVTIHIPTIPLKAPVHRLLKRYRGLGRRSQIIVIWSAGLLLVLLVGVLTILQLSSQSSLETNSSTDNVRRFGGELQKTPDYPTLLPAGKTVEELGGWTRVSPPESNAVFAYVDYLGNKQLNVSQQPLPSEFKEDTEAQIEQLAAGYGATERISTGDITLFVGTSAKGPQSVIFVKNDLLILIKSVVPLSEDEWIGYATNLQ